MAELKEITTKSGFVIKESWCRKCAKMKPASEFYEATDMGKIDTLMIMSVCKNCILSLYEDFYKETSSIEKAIHKICTSLNIKYSNDAASAVKSQIETLHNSGKKVSAVIGIYLSKLVSLNPSMEKNIKQNLVCDDVSVIFTEKINDPTIVPIPADVLDFWGKELSRADIEFLEREYSNFKNTHKADTHAEVVLLKEVCYTMLRIRHKRMDNDPDTADDMKELQSLMKNLAISPNAVKTTQNAGVDTFGVWIADIEREEPAQWLLSDPRGDIYRDVANTDEYYNKYMVRPLKNFIQGSKDFNIDEGEIENSEFDPNEFDNFVNIDDGEVSDE